MFSTVAVIPLDNTSIWTKCRQVKSNSLCLFSFTSSWATESIVWGHYGIQSLRVLSYIDGHCGSIPITGDISYAAHKRLPCPTALQLSLPEHYESSKSKAGSYLFPATSTQTPFAHSQVITQVAVQYLQSLGESYRCRCQGPLVGNASASFVR